MATLTLVPAATVPAALAVDNRLTLPWPERANTLQINDAATFQVADSERAVCKDFIKQIHAEEDPVCKSAWDNWQLSTQHRSERLKPFETSVDVYDTNMKAWNTAEKQRAREAQRAIEAAAYTRTIVEREAQVEHIENTGGSIGEVRSVVERPVALPVAPAAVMATAAAPAKPLNSRIAEKWCGEVTDVYALVEFALVGPTPPPEVKAWIQTHARRELLAMLTQDKSACNSLSNSTKGAMSVPGVRFWDEGKVASLPKKKGV